MQSVEPKTRTSVRSRTPEAPKRELIAGAYNFDHDLIDPNPHTETQLTKSTPIDSIRLSALFQSPCPPFTATPCHVCVGIGST